MQNSNLKGISRRKFVALSATALTALTLPSFLTGCSNDSGSKSEGHAALNNVGDALTLTLFTFDTVVQISAYCEQDLLDKAGARCEYFQNILSQGVAESDVCKINEAGGNPVEVSAETADLIALALPYCELSEGKFDITIGAASLLWDFNEGIKPDDATLAEAIKHIDYRNVQLEGNTVTLLDPEAKIDLGAISKGYIADDLAKLFLEGGCESALINLGGNVYALGTKPDGSDWNIGIQDPNDSRGITIASVEVSDKSVVTSGLYERQFTLDGVQYYHILDPKTGYPVITDLQSTSIISEKSAECDAYSTILFLNGVTEAMRIVESTPEIEALLIDDEGTITQSSGFGATLL